LKLLDAGVWESAEFKGERIPTLRETLKVLPYNIWLNVHLKGEGDLVRLVAENEGISPVKPDFKLKFN